jgi:hypothetical protein
MVKEIEIRSIRGNVKGKKGKGNVRGEGRGVDGRDK